ncbi:MAG: FKBP-type peptidyl-prolyl cis-trans isomerase [Chlamydiota bacterium]
MNKKNFTHEILQRLSAQIPPPAKIICSNQLMDFFTEEERNRLPHLIAQTILNTFADEISPSFFQGMGAAETEIQETLEYSDIKFLDIFWNRNKAALQQTTCFFEQISNQKNVHCLIPNKLYFCILKESTSINALSKNNRAIKAKYLLKDCEENVLVGSYELQEPPILNLDEMIPGLSYGLLGMKEGEIREIFIHPDFAYGASDFGNGQVVQAVVELIHLDTPTEESVFPFLKPAEVSNYAPDISSCSEFIELQKKHAYACGLRSWIYYKKAAPLITLDSVLDEIPKMEKTALSDLDENLLLRLEWLLLQDSGS